MACYIFCRFPLVEMALTEPAMQLYFHASTMTSVFSASPSNQSHQNMSAPEPVSCYSGPERIVVPVIFSIVIVGGCIGNTMVLTVLVKHRHNMRNSTNILMLNLAVADMLFLVFCIPFHAVIYSIPSWPFGEFMCKFVHLMQYSSMIASVFTLVGMAADRYLVVRYPIHTKFLRNPTAATFVCVAIWIASLSFAIPAPIFYTVKTYIMCSGSLNVCADDWGSKVSDRPTFFLLLFLLGYAIPLLAIFVLSVLMVINLWANHAPNRTNMVESVRNKRKATRLVIVLVVVFGVSWLPYHISWIWSNYFQSTFQNTYVFYYFRVFSSVISYANCGINPVIYAFLSENFRKSLCHSVRFEQNRITPSQNGYRMSLLRRRFTRERRRQSRSEMTET